MRRFQMEPGDFMPGKNAYQGDAESGFTNCPKHNALADLSIRKAISRIVSAEKRRAEESGVVGLMGGVSVVLLRPHCILTSEEYPMKTHGNQWLVTL